MTRSPPTEVHWTPEEYELIDRLNKENVCVYFRKQLLLIHKNGNAQGTTAGDRKVLIRTGLVVSKGRGRGFSTFTLTPWAINWLNIKTHAPSD